MTDRVPRGVKAWRDLAQLMPGWRPTLAGLQKLDEGPRELGAAIRSIARGWRRDDARWDVLQGVLEFYKRQHAHELAEEIRTMDTDPGTHWVADHIDPLKQQGDTE